MHIAPRLLQKVAALLPAVKGTRRASIESLAAGFVGQGSLIITGVLLARLLGPEQRGYLALLLLWPALISRVGELGLPNAAAYYIAREPGSFHQILGEVKRLAIRQAPLLVACHAAVLTAYLIGKPSAVISAGILTIANVPASMAVDYGFSMLQGQRRFSTLNLLRNLNQAMVCLGLVILVALHRTSLVSATVVVLVALCATGAAFLFAALSYRPSRAAQVRAVSSGELMRFGLHGLLGSLYPLETFRIDQIAVGLLLSPAALGLYVVGFAFTNIPLFIASSLGFVAYPAIAAETNRRQRRRIMWQFFWLVLGLSIVPVIVLEAAMGALVPWFFGHQFEQSITIARIVLVGGLVLAARRILAEGLRGGGNPAAGTLAEATLLAVLLPGLIVGSRYWGADGVAWAVTCAGLAGLLVLVGLDFWVNARTLDKGVASGPDPS
jgi:O-antigen/teichoic acid export membrane protein